MNKQNSERQKGFKNHFFGKHHSVESRRKNSNSHKGEKGQKWKGGISSKQIIIRMGIEIRLWREAVFARDNWTCQKCKRRGLRLQAHHIFNFAQWPELQTTISNGITFCKEDHQKFHKKYGLQNNTREQLEEFIN